MATNKFDVIIVGAGPAGSSAAIKATQGGLKVLVLERGEYVGAKNMTGGMLLAQALENVVPEYWEDAPLERAVEHQYVMMTSGERTMTLDIGNSGFLKYPYNGFTVLRRDFDAWLAGKARQAGATIITGTVVEDLIRENGKVVGVRTGRPDGDVYAEIVILADGVNSLLATKAGLFRRPVQKHHYSIGIKELLALPADIINERFGLEGNAGAAYMAVGEFCRNIPGGAFLYTNKESLSVGIVAQPEALVQQKITLDEVLEKFKERKEIARLIREAKLLEYSAHLIPEGGYNEMPALHANGLLVAGDAAGFVVNTGLVLIGMNLAIDSGSCAGEAARIALGKGKSGYDELGNTYKHLLSKSAALSAMQVHKNAPSLVNSPRIFNEYPDMINNVLQGLVEIKPGEQQGFVTIAKGSIKGIKLTDIIRDVIVGVRAL